MKLKWRNRIYSGALQFTIFISVIIALLLTGVILLISTHRYFREQSKAIIDNIQLAETGINYLKLQPYPTPDTIALNVPEIRNEQNINVHLSQWGIYEKAYVKTIHRKKVFIKCALLGSKIKKENRLSLYLAETNKPLMVVGNTRIDGNAALPQQGVRTGNITGHSYYNNQLIYGSIEKSEPYLPKLKYDYRETANYYLNSYEPLNNDYFIDLIPGTVTQQSFAKPTKYYTNTSAVIIGNITLKGNIIIHSDEKITVTSSALLSDVILSAPVIEVLDNVTGNFQAFANTTIKIGKNCRLNYPSTLVLIENNEHNTAPTGTFNQYLNKLYVNEGCTIKGTLCYIKDNNTESNFTASIFIANNCHIEGEVYCEKNLELRGNVTGSVYTEQFLTYEGGTNFINHLYDVTLVSGKLHEDFGGILFENQQKTVAKWIY
ncbi:hypothetical protein [Flavobacterium sp.]|uniref:hypothetical protein n=1 Tax=Flavobacterium sp. TaxID=239 RepID=UPI003A953E36